MNSYDRIIRILNSLSIYNLDDGSLIQAEIKSYCYVLDKVFKELEYILYGMFLDSVDSKYFSKFEKLFSMPVTKGIGEEHDKIAREKVKMMKKRLDIKNDDFNLEGIKKALSSGGMEVEITENFSNKTVDIKILEDKNIYVEREEKEAFIKSFLPVHCKLNLI